MHVNCKMDPYTNVMQGYIYNCGQSYFGFVSKLHMSYNWQLPYNLDAYDHEMCMHCLHPLDLVISTLLQLLSTMIPNDTTSDTTKFWLYKNYLFTILELLFNCDMINKHQLCYNTYITSHAKYIINWKCSLKWNWSNV